MQVCSRDLLSVPKGSITEAGLRWNIDVGLQYLATWLQGNGCVPIYNLMEDAATAEICRAQVWQWVRHHAKLDDGQPVTAELVRQIAAEELEKLATGPERRRFQAKALSTASRVFEEIMTSGDFPEFLTSVAYKYLA